MIGDDTIDFVGKQVAKASRWVGFGMYAEPVIDLFEKYLSNLGRFYVVINMKYIYFFVGNYFYMALVSLSL